MSGTVARSIICLSLLIAQADESEPLIHDDTVGRLAVLGERPQQASAMEREIWFEAVTDADIALVRTYLYERVLFGDLPKGSGAKQWWKDSLQDDPAAVARAIARVDTRYTTWAIDNWPEALNTVKPAYRLVLVEAMFEAYVATTERIAQLRTQVSEFKPVDRFPGGLPANTDPAWVKDPGLRAEVQKNIDELARQEMIKEELERTASSVAELSDVPGRALELLYKGTSEPAIQSLAKLIITHHWTDNDLYFAIIRDWPDLADAISDLQLEDIPD